MTSYLTAYQQAAWTVSTPRGERRFQLGAGALSDADLLPMGIVTAYNPRSSRLTAMENAERNEQLSEELARRGLAFYPSLATAPTTTDSSWDEPGFAVIRAPFGEVVRIAADLDQNAIVWVDSHDVARLVVTRDGFCESSPGEFLPL